MYPDLADEALAALLKENDAIALETLFNRYYHQLCQFSAVYTRDHAVAEELVSNLFIRIWDNRVDAAILNVKHYLFSATKNLSLNHLSKKKEPLQFIDDTSLPDTSFQHNDTPLKILTGRETCNSILSLIDRLPLSQRQVLLLTRIDNLSKHEVAAQLGISVRTVETTLYESIKRLRGLMNEVVYFSSLYDFLI